MILIFISFFFNISIPPVSFFLGSFVIVWSLVAFKYYIILYQFNLITFATIQFSI